MKIAHLADLHLGFRSYRATTPDGRNQRESDVEDAFMRAVSQIEAELPDVILVAGDVFHVSRPHPRAIQVAENGFSRLADVADVYIAGGNHEHPRSKPNGNALEILARIPGVEAYPSQLGSTDLPDGYHLTIVPEPALDEVDVGEIFRSGNADPDKSILLMHGAVNQRGGKLYHHGALPVDVLNPDAWGLIALGDFHVFTRLAPGAFYSGSLEYTSSDIWMEARTGIDKGWVLHDLDKGQHLLMSVGARTVVDLPIIDADGMTDTELSESIILAVGDEVGNPSENIIRQVCENVARGVRRSLEWDTIHDIKEDALHYQLDLRSKEQERGSILGVVSDSDDDADDKNSGGQARTPAGEARRLIKVWDPTPGVERDDVLAKTLEYIETAEKT